MYKKPNMTLHKGSKNVTEANEGYKGNKQLTIFLFMANKERGGHILHKGSGYHITQECSVCGVERNQLHVKTCKFVNPSMELIIETVLCWQFYCLLFAY